MCITWKHMTASEQKSVLHTNREENIIPEMVRQAEKTSLLVISITRNTFHSYPYSVILGISHPSFIYLWAQVHRTEILGYSQARLDFLGLPRHRELASFPALPELVTFFLLLLRPAVAAYSPALLCAPEAKTYRQAASWPPDPGYLSLGYAELIRVNVLTIFTFHKQVKWSAYKQKKARGIQPLWAF